MQRSSKGGTGLPTRSSDNNDESNSPNSPRPTRRRARGLPIATTSTQEAKSQEASDNVAKAKKSSTRSKSPTPAGGKKVKKKKKTKSTLPFTLSYPLVAVMGTKEQPKYWNIKVMLQGSEYIPGLKAGFNKSMSGAPPSPSVPKNLSTQKLPPPPATAEPAIVSKRTRSASVGKEKDVVPKVVDNNLKEHASPPPAKQQQAAPRSPKRAAAVAATKSPPPLPPPAAAAPLPLQLPTTTTTTPPVAEDGNFYYCQICQQPGDVVCCDGCPCVFHRDCLQDGSESKTALLNDVEPWYCPECIMCLDDSSKKQDSKQESKSSKEPPTASLLPKAALAPTRSSKRKRSMDIREQQEHLDKDVERKDEDMEAFLDSVKHEVEEEESIIMEQQQQPKKKKKTASSEETPKKASSSSKKSSAATTPTSSKKKDKKDKKKKKKKKDKKRDRGDSPPPTSPRPSGAAKSPTPAYASQDNSDDDTEDPFQGLFSSVTTGIIQATPAFYFFLAENRLKIERSLIRKHRTFNRLPKGMERNELIAKEGAHWWIKLPPNEVDRFISESMRDFEKRVVEWKEEKTISQMTSDVNIDIDDTDPDVDQQDDAKLSYENHKRLYQNTSVGAKPWKPDPKESNNKVLLELLQDNRFHSLPMLQPNRSDKEYGGMDVDKVTIPYFDVHGPVATSLGDECLGCSRGFAHFCNVLKRNVPAVLNRARLQPPMSSLMATRIGLGFKEENPEPPKFESEEQTKNAELFSVRDVPAISSAKALPRIPYEPLTAASHRGDDIVRFVEEVVHMKVPEPQRPPSPTTTRSPGSQQVAAAATRKAITSRAALPIRKNKLPINESSMDDVDGGTILRKCGRCRTISEADGGCVQCRRAQLVINLSREDPDKSNVNGESQQQQQAQPSEHDALLRVSTTMQSRVQMKDFVPQLQSVGDEAVSNHIGRQRWTPYAAMPPHKITAPVFDPSKPKPDSKEEESNEDEEASTSDSSAEEAPMEPIVERKEAKAMRRPSIHDRKRPMEDNDDDQTQSGSKRLRSSARIDAKERHEGIPSYNRDSLIDSQDLDSSDRQALLKRFATEKEQLSKRCLTVACCGILLGMMRRDPQQLFAEPVEAEGYSQIIKYPVYFSKMKKKLLAGEYSSFSSFIFEAQLLCDNALIYNPADSVYSKTAKEMSDLLKVMKKRSQKWMAAIKEAHSQAFHNASMSELVDALERLDKLSPNSFMIMDSFRDLRKTWPAAVEMLKNHDRLRKSVESDFMRTRENETAYYGNLAIRRAAAAAAYSLAPYPDSSGIFNVVGRRSHTEDEHLREHVAQKVAQVVEPPQLKDVPNWREEMIIRVLRKAQSRRMEGMAESPTGCAKCDGIRVDQDLKSMAKSLRGRRISRKKESTNDIARVDTSRMHLTTGLGSENIQKQVVKHREFNIVHEKELLAGKPEAILTALEKLDDIAVSVRASRVHGMGLFADQPFQEGDVVAEYIGEYVSPAVTDAREKIYQEERIQDYQFRVGSNLVIDATKRGGHGRYINHSCNPNCTTRLVPGASKDLKRVVIVASRGIQPQEEFTYDYQFPLETDLEARIPCNCHSDKCRGFMNWDLPEKGSTYQDFRTQKRGANMRDRIRRLGRPLKGDKS